MPRCAAGGRSRPSGATRRCAARSCRWSAARRPSGFPAEELRELLRTLRTRPVLTAHPTEAKRVTVLEKHRRIYRLLVDLESPRWTPRERAGLVRAVRNEIELLLLTGELRLEKPTVEQEVYWALHFFNETLFEAVPALHDKLERALAQHLSRRARSTCRPSSSSAPGWAATATAIRSSPTTSPAARWASTGSRRSGATASGSASSTRLLSVSERSAPIAGGVPRAARADARRERRRPRHRDAESRGSLPPVSVLRGSAARRHARGGRRLSARRARRRLRRAEELAADVRALERALAEAAPALAPSLVRPVRREIELFRFSTVRLDIRENTTRLHQALGELWRARRGRADEEPPPDPASDEWGRWIQPELARPRHEEVRLDCSIRRGGDARHVPAGGRAPREARSRGVRIVHPEHDPLGERRARRLPHGQGGRPLPRHAWRRALHAPDRAAVRDDRRPPGRARHHARAAGSAGGPPERAGAGRACRRS